MKLNFVFAIKFVKFFKYDYLRSLITLKIVVFSTTFIYACCGKN